MVQEEMVVSGRVRNMRQLGPFIHRLCYGKETYRLRRRTGQRRELLLLSFIPELLSLSFILVMTLIFSILLVRDTCSHTHTRTHAGGCCC